MWAVTARCPNPPENSPGLSARHARGYTLGQHLLQRHQRRIQPLRLGQGLLFPSPENRQERLLAIAGDALLHKGHQVADLAGLAQVGRQAIKASANALLLRGDAD